MGGQGVADLRLDLPDGAPGRLSVESDLDGISLAIPALGWRLGEGTTGALEAEVLLGPAPDVPNSTSQAPGLQMTGRGTLRPGGGLARLTWSGLRVGTWLDVAGALVGRGQGVPPAIEIDGGRLTLTDAPNSAGQSSATGRAPTVRLNRVDIAPDLALTDVTGSFEAGGGLGANSRRA
jgi:hypothetical protein